MRTLAAPSIRLVGLAAALAAPAFGQESSAVFDASLVVGGAQHNFDRLLDLDADGDMDAVGWWWQSSTQGWVTVSGFYNPGDGSLEEQWVQSFYTDWDHPLTYVTAVGSLDGDARDDWVMAVGHRLHPYSSNGSVEPDEWPELMIPAGESVRALKLVDLDQDGRDDLVLGTETKLRAFINNYPSGNFLVASSVSIAGGAAQLEIGEVDGDGRPDVLVGTQDRVRLFSAIDGALVNIGSFLDDVPGAPIVLCGELTGDGLEDVILFSESGQQQLLRRTGPDSFTQEPLVAGGPATDLADVNGDGLLDGVCCGGGGSYELYNDDPSAFQVAINDGDGGFGDSSEFKIQSLGGEHIGGAADMDGDGDADLVAGRTIYYARGPLYAPPHVALGGGKQHQREVADLSVDGFPDIRIGLETCMRNLGDGSFLLDPPGAAPAPGASEFQGPGFPGDWDGDGDTDLVVQRLEGGTLMEMRLLRNDGSGWFEDAGAGGPPGVDFNLGSQALNQPWKSLCVDVDGDGDLDLVVNRVEGTAAPLSYTLGARAYLNDGGGSFTPAVQLADEMVKAVAELNGDAFPDLIVINDTDFRPRYRLARGDGTFYAGVELHSALLTYPKTRVEAQDFDHDGDVDIAVRGTSDWMAVFQNDGAASFTMTFPLPGGFLDQAAESSHSLVALDYDGDGWDDLVVGPVERAPNSVVLIRKRAAQPGWYPPTQLQCFLPTAAADVDLDGDVDLFTNAVVFNTRLEDGLGSSYCAVNTNSTAAPALIAAHGSTSVTQDLFVLTASNVPSNQFGVFYYGPETAELPFGDGFRCVGGGQLGTFRLPPVGAGSGNVLSYALDLLTPTQPEGQITPGSLWHFQAWYRDPAAQGAGFNLSNGLSVTFSP